ncbi:integrase arm-type DNA-binding domain-containing protein [Rhizorhabdus histidinilytica]|uniref:integrase arm-type DNA-binding domain-containing protein n=1 Tax=Rhizorhabdus histidinilytica TaxID=439228 RepID=UPI00321FB8A1
MLTEHLIDATLPRTKPFKMADSHGLYLFITPAGSKCWRMKYRFGGRELCLTFGQYPGVSIEAARRLRDEAKTLLRAKQDPRAALEVAAQRDAAAVLLTPGEEDGEATVYFVRACTGLIKIGVTKDVRRRLAQIQLGFAEPITLLGTIAGGYATEGMLHRMFAESAVGGEWFEPSPRMLEFIDENCELPSCR